MVTMRKKKKTKSKRGRKVLHPEGGTVNIAVTVPGGLLAKLNKWAESKGLNRSQAITEAIRRL